MTLIASCLTGEAVVVVADRRLTLLDSGAVVDDEACKAVLLGTQAVITYSGLAYLKPDRRSATDLWIVDLLSPPPSRLQDVVGRLGAAAYETFRELPRRTARHAFMISGWQMREQSLEPVHAHLSNALDRDGRWLASARPEFEMRSRRLGNEPFALKELGYPLGAERARILRHRLGEARNREPSRLASLLATAVREVALEKSAVGTGLLVTILPRDAASAGGVRLARYEPDAEGAEVVFPDAEGPTTFYVPPKSNDGVLYAPHYIAADFSMADIRVHPRALSPDEIKRSYEEGLRRRQ